MTGEKRDPQDELVTAFFDISRAHFHSPVVDKLRSQCKVIHHAHEVPWLIVQCVERRTQHNVLIRTVNGRWRNWTTTLLCSIRGCTNILSQTSVY